VSVTPSSSSFKLNDDLIDAFFLLLLLLLLLLSSYVLGFITTMGTAFVSDRYIVRGPFIIFWAIGECGLWSRFYLFVFFMC